MITTARFLRLAIAIHTVLRAHYSDVIMGAMASQITSLTIVYSSVYSGADQRKHQRSVSLTFVGGIHRWPVISRHKWPVTRKMAPFDDVIMINVHYDLWRRPLTLTSTLRTGQIGRHFANTLFNVLSGMNILLFYTFTPKFVLKGSKDKQPALVKVMVWLRHDDVIKWKHFPCYWPFVRGIRRSPVNSPHKGQWRGALIFPLICSWITVEQTIVKLVIGDAIGLIMTSL